MAFNKQRIIYISVALLCAGCASIPTEQKLIYEQGYRAGVEEQVKDIASKFQGGEFPYYHWAAPMVQELNVPAHIEQGVFIPEHKELVIIKPGEWVKSSAYPIAIQENKQHEDIPHSSVTDITSLPASRR